MLRGRLGILYGLSFALHAGVAFGVVSIKPVEAREATRITMREHKQKPAEEEKAPPPPPPPPPPVIAAPKPVRRAPKPAAPEPAAPAPAPAATAAPAATSAAPVADFGLSMTGSSGRPGGIAVPVAGTRPAAPARVTKTIAPKALAKAPAGGDTCLEQLIKPKPIAIPQPVYADSARAAGITGKVRVELTVDETGAVVAVKVIEGLGYGLDEAALEAARNARFEPATRCGTATRTTFTIGIRFSI